MLDHIYVNILNEGQIPWIRKTGPLFGYKIAYGMYQLIYNDPRLKIEIVKSKEEADRAREKYYASKNKKPIILHDDIKIEDEKPVILETPNVESVVLENTEDEEMLDSQMDLLLEILDETPAEPENPVVESIKVKKEDVIRKYTEEELKQMTRTGMKNILKERGYVSGPYAGKYHDTSEILRHKVLSTQ